MTGEGRGKKETLFRKPHDFEKLRSPTNVASDWCGAVSVDYLALETSIKPGTLCLSGLIWFVVPDYKCFGLIFIWIVFVRRFMRSGVFKLKLKIEQWRLGKANLLGMTGCGSDWKKWIVCWRYHQRKSEHRYSTTAKAAMDKRFISFLKWKDSLCLLEI